MVSVAAAGTPAALITCLNFLALPNSDAPHAKWLMRDTKEPSATLKIVSQGDTEVTLAYPLYRKNDPLSTPSGGQARVTFQLNNGKLVPLGKIPPASSTAALSRQ